MGVSEILHKSIVRSRNYNMHVSVLGGKAAPAARKAAAGSKRLPKTGQEKEEEEESNS